MMRAVYQKRVLTMLLRLVLALTAVLMLLGVVGTPVRAHGSSNGDQSKYKLAKGLQLEISAAPVFPSGRPVTLKVALHDTSAGLLNIAGMTLTQSLNSGFQVARISDGKSVTVPSTSDTLPYVWSHGMTTQAITDGGSLTVKRDLSKIFVLAPGEYRVYVDMSVETLSRDGSIRYYGSVVSNALTIEIVP
jgi:D-serine deaminase-like pyridoxal phosphate-dependent protein